MNLSIDRPSSEQRSEFACENAFQQPLGDRERAPERYEVDEQVKMEVRDLDLHYGDSMRSRMSRSAFQRTR